MCAYPELSITTWTGQKLPFAFARRSSRLICEFSRLSASASESPFCLSQSRARCFSRCSSRGVLSHFGVIDLKSSKL